MKAFRAVMMIMLAVAAACAQATTDPTGEAAQHSISAGDTVNLRVGESVRVLGTGVLIVFRGVATDSRCPTDVECVWEGDAHVQLDASTNQSQPVRLDLHTGPLEPREVAYGSVLVRLVGVEPEARSDRMIRAEDYVARIEVTTH